MRQARRPRAAAKGWRDRSTQIRAMAPAEAGIPRTSARGPVRACQTAKNFPRRGRSEEHTSELQSRENLVCRLLLARPPPGSILLPYTPLFRSSRNPMVSFADAPGAPATRGRERLARPIDPDPGHGSSRGRYTTDVGARACQSLSDGEKFPPAGQIGRAHV